MFLHTVEESMEMPGGCIVLWKLIAIFFDAIERVLAGVDEQFPFKDELVP